MCRILRLHSFFLLFDMFDVVVVIHTASLAIFMRLVGMMGIPAVDRAGADASPMCTVVLVVDVPVRVVVAGMNSLPKELSDILDTLVRPTAAAAAAA